MKSEVTLRQFRYFIAAATSGQFSAAAVSEHVSQSAITSAVQSLERQLKARLFERLPHGVVLTPEGQVFFHHARHVMDSVNDAMRHASLLPQTATGTIRLAATYTVLGYFLPDLLSRFKRSYPQVEIDLVDMDRPALEQALADETIDLGIGLLSNIEARQRYGHHLLVRSRRRAWMAANHALAEQAAVSLSELAQCPYILLTVDDADAAAIRHWGAAGARLKVAMRTGSLEALRGLVAYGFGVSILSDLVYRPWSLEGKKIIAIPISDPVAPMDVGLLWPKKQKPCGLVDVFRQFLIHACDSDGESHAAGAVARKRQ
ncbi:MAG: LysR family transcriptional regulator [Pollutimonas bauzanensis]|uniref:Transcriptional regulator, LysR family n=1 Tax=Pollutimonas bauzanensis TaxID=658167 RepID=A0A1M5YNP2_9BURK|nr:LysR family transcriptional regulator [Pollutimonas bauzanensis]SHI13737.1 transcriptional regulator, LysR family [Pollutimonas bauzanensis]